VLHQIGVSFDLPKIYLFLIIHTQRTAEGKIGYMLRFQQSIIGTITSTLKKNFFNVLIVYSSDDGLFKPKHVAYFTLYCELFMNI